MRPLLLSMLVLAACGEAPVDMKDPAAVTRRFVNAYNARDLSHMLPLVDQVNLDAVKEALAGGPGSEAYTSIFQPEMTDLIARDGGKIDGPRFDGGDAVFKVGDTVDGDVHSIKLSPNTDGHWLIVEFPTLSEREYLALPEAEPKR